MGLRTADSDNPKGYYEFERVKKLRQGENAWLPQARGKAVKVISALLPYLPDYTKAWLESTSHVTHIDIDYNGMLSDPPLLM